MSEQRFISIIYIIGVFIGMASKSWGANEPSLRGFVKSLIIFAVGAAATSAVEYFIAARKEPRK
jgi:hypothetical protein